MKSTFEQAGKMPAVPGRKIAAEVHQRAQGRVKCAIVQDGKVVKEFPWQKNLILNNGLNLICSSISWEKAMEFCHVGTGTTNTNNGTLPGDTGTGTATTFTGPAAFDFTTLAAPGDMIKMTTGSDAGAEVRITAVTDADTVEYTPSRSLSAGEFVVYRTSQTALSVWVKTNNGYLPGASSRTDLGNVRTVSQTYEFSAEVGSVSYTEIGLNSGGASGTNLFSRIKLASPISLIATQQLRVTYELSITASPSTPQAKTFNITGWPVAPSTTTDGDEQLAQINYGSSVGPGVWEPSGGGAIFLAQASALPAFGGVPSPPIAVGTYFAKTVSLLAYTPLNFFRDKTTTFAVTEAVGTNWRSMGIASNASGFLNPSFMCVFDQAQTKANTHTLTLTFRVSVGRVLG